MNRKGIEYGVLQREVESNRQIYESLLQRTKETGISSSERRRPTSASSTRRRVPRGPMSPNVQRDLTRCRSRRVSLLALGLAFFFEYLDNRIKTPNEMKQHLGVPFLGMIPAVTQGKDEPNPLINAEGVPNFAEAFKTVRTNVLFSSAEDGLRSARRHQRRPGRRQEHRARRTSRSRSRRPASACC